MEWVILAATPKGAAYRFLTIVWRLTRGRMGAFRETLGSLLPGAFIHSVQIGATEDEDKNKGFFDQVARQVAEVCEKLKEIPELSEGFNAMGFSQVYFFDFIEWKCLISWHFRAAFSFALTFNSAIPLAF